MRLNLMSLAFGLIAIQLLIGCGQDTALPTQSANRSNDVAQSSLAGVVQLSEDSQQVVTIKSENLTGTRDWIYRWNNSDAFESGYRFKRVLSNWFARTSCRQRVHSGYHVEFRTSSRRTVC